MSKDTYTKRVITAPTTRDFDTAIVAHTYFPRRQNRLELRAAERSHGHDECFLSIMTDTREQVAAVARELQARGVDWQDLGGDRRMRFGGWRRYLAELERAHVALEVLGWTLAADEQALMDTLDAFGRQTPALVASDFREAVAV